MQAYDIVVLLLLISSTVWGARRGFTKQLATLASLVLGYGVAVNFRAPVAQFVDAPHPWDLFTAMFGLFMVTSLGVWIAFRFVNGTIEKIGLKTFDAQMGGLFGLAKGVLIAMAVTMFAVVMLGETQRSAVLDSFSGYNICRMLNRAHRVVPAEWQQAMEPYLETVEEHQQFVEQPPQDEFPDPFEVTSPSDTPSRYDDPLFGSVPVDQYQQQSAQPYQSRYDDSTWHPEPAQSQASLQDPLFDTRR